MKQVLEALLDGKTVIDRDGRAFYLTDNGEIWYGYMGGDGQAKCSIFDDMDMIL